MNVLRQLLADPIEIDPETGEILEPRAEFRIDTDESADWVLGKMLAEQSTAWAARNTDLCAAAREVLAAAEEIALQSERTLTGLHRRFDAELGEYARAKLRDSKSRTWRTALGSISLRRKPGRCQVDDADAALKLAEEMGWTECVKTTKMFLISGLPDGYQEAADAQGLGRLCDRAFLDEPDSEVVTVTPGAKATTK